MAKLRIPKPQNYLLIYEGKEGLKQYNVSLPIDKTDTEITVYAFGKGVRTFKVNKIVDMRRLGDSVVVRV